MSDRAREAPTDDRGARWPLWAALALLWTSVAFLYVAITRLNEGHFVYILDDAYIPMAVARNFVQHGVWGVTLERFTSSTSSILWPLLLSGLFALFGAHDWLPLATNVVCGTAVVVLVDRLLRGLPGVPRFVALTLVIFVTPMPALIFHGLEHVLHLFLTIAFLYVADGMLGDGVRNASPGTGGPRLARGPAAMLVLLSACVVSTRYEGLFLVFVACVMFAARRHVGYGLLLGGVGVLPIALFGLFSVSRGWYFFPVPVLLKGNTAFGAIGEIVRWFGFLVYQEVTSNAHVLLILLASLIALDRALRRGDTAWRRPVPMLVLFIVTMLLHLNFSAVGDFYRHDAYLVGAGVFALAVGGADGWQHWSAIQIEPPIKGLRLTAMPLLLAGALVVLPFAYRATESFRHVARATAIVYLGDYQAAQFVRARYPRASIASGDIGAVCFYAPDVRLLDTDGLGTIEVAKALRDQTLTTDVLNRLALERRAQIALQVAVAGESRTPPVWREVGEWTTDQASLPQQILSIMAITPRDEGDLIANLRAFAPLLPRGVKQSGQYVAATP